MLKKLQITHTPCLSNRLTQLKDTHELYSILKNQRGLNVLKFIFRILKCTSLSVSSQVPRISLLFL